MSDFVYKQMIDKVTNLPIQGGIFFLRDVEGVREDVPLVELPDDGTGSTQGRYVSETEVNNGVYAVYRTVGAVSTVTGDEVHVEAGRVTHGEVDDAPLTPVTSRLLGGVVYALGFLPDGQADDADIPSSYLTEALAYAAANGIHKVVVGSYKGRDTWIGSTTIEIPEGVTDLQLDGATVFCTVANLPIFQYVGTSTLEISSGELKAAGAGSAAHVVSSAPITYRNVYFSGNSQTLGFTTQTIAGQPTDWVTYVGCRNVRVDTGMRYLPASLNGGNLAGSCKQAAFGGSVDTFDPGAVPPIESKSILYTTLDGISLDQILLEPRKPMTPPPAYTGGGPFTSSVDAMKAVKTLWFTDKPKMDLLYSSAEVADGTALESVGLNTMSVRRYSGFYGATGTFNYDDTLPDQVDNTVVSDPGNSGDISSGILVRKFYHVNATKYNRIEVEAFSHFRAFATWTDLGDQIMGWAPREFTLNMAGVTNWFRDLTGGVDMTMPTIARATIDVNVGGSADYKPAQRFFGTVAKVNNTLIVTTEANNQRGAQATPFPDVTRMIAYPDDVDSGPVFVRVHCVIENPARPGFPRFK